MRTRRVALITGLLVVGVPSSAYAASAGAVPEVILTGSGVIGLIAAAVLLLEMLSLRKLAQGAAIADTRCHITLPELEAVASAAMGRPVMPRMRGIWRRP